MSRFRLVKSGSRSVKGEPCRERVPIVNGGGWAPICQDRTLSRAVFGSGDGMGRWNVNLKEKRDEGKKNKPYITGSNRS